MRCLEGALTCSREAVAVYHGVHTEHPVCLAHAQRHVDLAWPCTWLEWLALLPGSPIAQRLGGRSP
jgi:hypothetical protein